MPVCVNFDNKIIYKVINGGHFSPIVGFDQT